MSLVKLDSHGMSCALSADKTFLAPICPPDRKVIVLNRTAGRLRSSNVPSISPTRMRGPANPNDRHHALAVSARMDDL